MTHIEYSETDGVLLLDRQGNVDLQEMLDVHFRINENYSDCKVLRVIDDISNSNLCWDHRTGHEAIFNNILSYIDGYELIKVALVVTAPLVTAKSFLYSSMATIHPKYIVQVFSSREAGRQWLVK